MIRTIEFTETDLNRAAFRYASENGLIPAGVMYDTRLSVLADGEKWYSATLTYEPSKLKVSK